MKKMEIQEIEDLLLGCAVLGTGGGGSLKQGLSMAKQTMENKDEQVKVVSVDEVPHEERVAVPYFCGSVSPEAQSSNEGGNDCLRAFEVLEGYIEQKLFAPIPAEIGGHNTAVAIAVAVEKDLPVVDGDLAGRSVPELQQSTFYIKNMPIEPISAVNSDGDVIIAPEISDDVKAEKIFRALAVASGNSIGVTDHPIKGKQLQGSIVEGTLTKAHRIGKSIRTSREEGSDPVEAAASVEDGVKLFQGKVKDADWSEEGGFTVGTVLIKGTGPYEKKEYKLWYKNEHIMSWMNGEVDVTAPDLICVLDSENGQPITNPNCEKGMKVSVVGYPAPSVWKTPRGSEVLGPKHFGYDIEYRPMKEIPRLNL